MFSIKFLNHASMLIKSGDLYYLTDPWYISPAFGGWMQEPSPLRKDVLDILDIPVSKLHVIISHGHDDHCDDVFIQNHLSEAQPIIAKFETKGFYRRITRNFKNEPIEIGREEKRINGIGFRSFVNKDFTHHDAMITLASDDEVIVHANDNWHEQPDDVISGINNMSRNKFIYYFSQLGIADCFPLKYCGYNEESKASIVKQRCLGYIDAFKSNILKTNPGFSFSYANQSRLSNGGGSLVKSPYKVMLDLLEKEKEIKQLCPGTIIEKRRLLEKAKDQETLFDYMLAGVEKMTNAFIKNKKITNLRIKFELEKRLSQITNNGDMVIYATSECNWRNIFIGRLNLESISIGGMGQIKKTKSDNIREIHHLISEFAYILQARIRRNGILDVIKKST